MRQTILSVTLEVKPESAAKLTALIDQLHNDANEGPGEGDFAAFMAKVPSIHFLSMNVFRAADYDPVFVIEANMDGGPGAFWGQLENAIGETLRAMLRCCKRPLDGDGALYTAVAAADSRQAVAPYFEARAHRPSVFHQGNRGMTRDRILAERDLFLAIRDEFLKANDGAASPYRDVTPAQVHSRLRDALLDRGFAWLKQKPPTRISTTEHIFDWMKFAAFVVLAILAVSLPGLLLAPVTPTGRFFLLLAIACIVIAIPLYRIREPLAGTGVSKPWAWLFSLAKALPLALIGVAIYALCAIPIAALAYWAVSGLPRDAVIRQGARMVALGLASAAFFSLPGLLLWLRTLERGDSSHDAPPIDEEEMRQMVQREDWIPQNHMGSIVLLKPGVLRTIIVHAGHLALHLLLRAKATNGYLGSMRTVHFAHWAFVNNGGRLMFFSNFDQSWESYLDDFIEKAHVGLTLAWGCGAGFPATRFLILDGASHGSKFKAWARHSMAVSRFWYSAYPDLTVDQIERNNRIANALRKTSLSEKEALAWIDEL
ncbi:hypothetical protein [Sphingomonas sp.]|uniref:hypothetical protein n=1 Tax=Sphingomonas sp. TaxID=28214 RepID=UPI000DB4221B|nr:hypothetical protein [Sphingomonas sp.]PZU10198.1 MAG: hypothetical protein DI605_06305 [Sphingomonas sp.]